MKNPEYIFTPILILILLAITNLIYIMTGMSETIEDMDQQHLLWLNDIYEEQVKLKDIFKEQN